MNIIRQGAVEEIGTTRTGREESLLFSGYASERIGGISFL